MKYKDQTLANNLSELEIDRINEIHFLWVMRSLKKINTYNLYKSDYIIDAICSFFNLDSASLYIAYEILSKPIFYPNKRETIIAAYYLNYPLSFIYKNIANPNTYYKYINTYSDSRKIYPRLEHKYAHLIKQFLQIINSAFSELAINIIKDKDYKEGIKINGFIQN